MIKFLFFIFICSFTVNAYAKDTHQFEVGTIPDSACAIKNGLYSCEFSFDKKFNTTPLVFLMPTITPDDKNAPSSLQINKITNSKVFFTQTIAPGTELNQLHMVEMKNINYIATEKGLIDLNGEGYLYAGSVNLNDIQIYKKNTSVCKKKPDSKECLYAKKLQKIKDYIGWHEIDIPDYFPGNASIITQVQSNNNQIWMTSVTDDDGDDDEFNIALELSEVIPENTEIKKENVAYLIGSGSGIYNGIKFLFKTISTKNTLNGDKSPIVSACDMLSPYGETIYNPIILGGKESRKGPNGGWLRLCDYTNQAVSFVVDEDTAFDKERGHHDEEVGLFIFGKNKQPQPEDICSIFPGPAQTWKSALQGNISISNAGRLVNTKEVNNNHVIGFLSSNIRDDNNKGCDGKRCYSNESLMLPKKILLPTYLTTSSTENYSSKWSDPIGNKKEFNSIIVNPKTTLSLSGNIKANVLYVEKGAVLNLSAGNYWIKKIIITGGVVNILQPGVNIYSYSMFLSSGESRHWWGKEKYQARVGGNNKLFVYLYKDDNWFLNRLRLSQSSRLHAFVYSEVDVDLSNSSIIYGNVTANNITITNTAEIIGSKQCDVTPVKYFLNMTPISSSIGYCRPQTINFSVLDSNGDIVNDFNGSIKLLTSVNDFNKVFWSLPFSDKKYDANNENTFPIHNGILTLNLKSSISTEVSVAASLVNYDSTENGRYLFTESSFKIEPNLIKLIAGKTQDITIKAYGCTDENDISSYVGEKELSLISNYIAPKTKGNSSIAIQDVNNKWQTKNALLHFNSSGEAKTTLKYIDAGIVNLEMQDLSLKGTVEVKSRPWTFAICPAQGKNIDGTALDGQPLVAAGDYFYLHVRPVVWQPGGSESDPISTTAYNLCNAAITPNFFKSDAPRLNVNISLNEKQPVSPVGGDYGQLSGNLQANNHTGNDYLNYRLTWSEVGSVPLKASGQSDYLGMPINPGYRSAGRIYPAYFALTNPEVTYANSSFTYLQQPFKVGFKLGAYNRSGDLVHNYLSFADDLKATFKVNSGNYVESGYTPLDSRLKRCGDISDPECLSRIDVAQKLSWPNFTKSALSQIDWPLAPYVVMRDQVRNQPITTEPDGPFFDWQLRIEQTTKPDGVTWRQLGVKSNRQGVLVGSNDLRYGRMVLQDAAGDIRGPVAIPLRVEYWNGAAFETNADDSGSHFDGRNYCRQILYPQPDKGNSPSTSGLGNVDQGVASNEKLVAYPDVPVLEPFKQQVRFWQRLSNSTEPKGNGISCRGTYTYQPWLSYNWRKQGDEDPSAVVTFGVYQGNKRIIYRAEAGVASSNYQ
ncbi:hypothetical protein FD722_04545 [Photobacterium damselae subsp. damselae]|uniref:DUF6701 domain-containing protein n=1 Tax=Photobacterium damselae TaxID=38293 RepID=UPI0010FF61C7|nr:DUF6701 domain-containing protein [Photobacterium damselae]TLS84367.1 hypothetical protein FD719_03435 [Photobacterium damselae subsp. damselae]TLS91309.1 hypothetical protein FD722_04545 [Photobacterium damselae subsp. damselae]